MNHEQVVDGVSLTKLNQLSHGLEGARTLGEGFAGTGDRNRGKGLKLWIFFSIKTLNESLGTHSADKVFEGVLSGVAAARGGD